MDNQQVTWKGRSGIKYTFTVFDLNAKFNPNKNGNYIFAKMTTMGWAAVYIGQGDIKNRTESHKKEGCVIKKYSTHIHAHPNGDEQSRIDEESDLLAQNTEAYEPTGCNIRPGG